MKAHLDSESRSGTCRYFKLYLHLKNNATLGLANLVTLTFLSKLTTIILPAVQRILRQPAAIKDVDKIIIIDFDGNRKSQFIQAKKVLDKDGFKATFYGLQIPR